MFFALVDGDVPAVRSGPSSPPDGPGLGIRLRADMVR
jgi:hypothetical protein